MNLFDMMKNIRGINTEEMLCKAIKMVKIRLRFLTKERMGRVYNSYLLNELNNNHVPARLINTLDLGLNYEHLFILVSNNDRENYYLSDLTFSEFNDKSNLFNDLCNEGYQSIDDDLLNCYLRVISKNKFDDYVSLDDLFYKNNDMIKKR